MNPGHFTTTSELKLTGMVMDQDIHVDQTGKMDE